DAYGRDVGGGGAGVAQGLACRFQLRCPDLHRVVLDPAGLRIVLAELALGQPAHLAVAVEQDGPRTGGALVQGQDVVVFLHGAGVLRLSWSPARGDSLRNDRVADAHRAPMTRKPAITSPTARDWPPRSCMLTLSVTATTATPRLMPSYCAIAAKLLARLIWPAAMSA